MRRAATSVAVLAVALVLAPLASGHTAAAAKPDRSKPPALGPVRPLKLPPVRVLHLANGLPVFLVEQHEVPVVQVDAVVRVGAGNDPLDKPGLASLTADMLDEGAGSKSALEIADEVDYLGAELTSEAGWDATVAALHVSVRRLERALPILADVVVRPTFPASELERVRTDRLTELLQWRDEPRAIASVAFARALYGGKHRYGTATLGTEASVRRFSRNDLTGFHAQAFRPDNAAIVVVGDVTAVSIQPQLEKAFGGWKASGNRAAGEVPLAPQVPGREIWIVHRPGAAQSEIRMFDYRLSSGPFVAAAAVQTDKTAPAVTEFFKELDAIRKTITDAEVAKAKNYVALSFPSEVETTGDIASKLAEQFIYGLSNGWLESYVSRIAGVTPAEVRRVASQYVDPEKVEVVIVGDRSKIEGELKALNLGPVKTLSVDELFAAEKK